MLVEHFDQANIALWPTTIAADSTDDVSFSQELDGVLADDFNSDIEESELAAAPQSTQAAVPNGAADAASHRPPARSFSSALATPVASPPFLAFRRFLIVDAVRQPASTTLRLLDERTDVETTCVLTGDWIHTRTAIGEFVNIVGPPEPDGSFVVSDDANLLIVCCRAAALHASTLARSCIRTRSSQAPRSPTRPSVDVAPCWARA